MSNLLLTELFVHCEFGDGLSPLDLAVSGGADSLALLALAAETGRELHIHHVDHGLREGSAAEAEVVAAAARRFDAKFSSYTVSVGEGTNLEARARAARYQVLPRGVLTGHTADDQAETVLINLLRGAALDGMAGMSPSNKPLLRLRRADTHRVVDALGLKPVNDSTNDDRRFLRNRLRHDVIPLLQETAERDIVPLLGRQALLLRADAEYLNALSAELDASDARSLAMAPPPLARRAVRLWLRAHLDDELHPPDAAAVERVRLVAAGEAVACDVSDGFEVRRSQQRLTLQRKKT